MDIADVIISISLLQYNGLSLWRLIASSKEFYREATPIGSKSNMLFRLFWWVLIFLEKGEILKHFPLNMAVIASEDSGFFSK